MLWNFIIQITLYKDVMWNVYLPSGIKYPYLFQKLNHMARNVFLEEGSTTVHLVPENLY